MEAASSRMLRAVRAAAVRDSGCESRVRYTAQEQRGMLAEAAGSASGRGCWSSLIRLHWALRAAAARDSCCRGSVSLRQAAGTARDADGGRGETEAEGISFRWCLRERLLTLAGGAGCSSSSEQSQLEQRETRAAGAARDAGSGWDRCFAAGARDSCFAAGAARGRGFWGSAGRRVRPRVQPQAVAAGAARVARRERCVQQRLCRQGCSVRWKALEQREMQAGNARPVPG